MGRSVSYPNSANVTFMHLDWDGEESDYMDFQDFIESRRDAAQDLWPSLEPCDKWVGREDHAILENSHAYFGVSEYCGVVATWFLAKDQDNDGRQAVADHWVASVGTKLGKHFGNMQKIATMSNGEAVYEKRA